MADARSGTVTLNLALRLALLVLTFAISALLEPPLLPGSNPADGSHATISVTSQSDDNDDRVPIPTDGSCDPDFSACTLREAVQAASAHSDADVISLPVGNHTLSIAGALEDSSTSGDLDITGSLTISGAGADSTTIDASGLGDRIIEIRPGAVAVISDLTMKGGNDPAGGGGLHNRGSLTLNRSAVTESIGGGIVSIGTNAGPVTLNSSTVSDNTAPVGSGSAGGILMYHGNLTLNNSTISGNSAEYGGGIATSNNGISLYLYDSTITANSGNGGGIRLGFSARISLMNTIVSGNAGGDCQINLTTPPSLGGNVVTSLGYNLNEDGSCLPAAVAHQSDLVGQDADLYSLALNSPGTTRTHALQAGSPAANAGSTGCPAGDQRGAPRQDGACDIGAYEVQPVAFVVNKTPDTNDGSCNADCSLREAITAANALAGPNTVDFDPVVFNIPRTITLASALPTIAGDLTTNGPAAALTVNANSTGRVFYIGAGVTARISALTATGGLEVNLGGGVRNDGTLTLTGVAVNNNTAGTGGGIFNNGTLILNASTVSGNTGQEGGGIANANQLSVNDSTVSGNAGAVGGGIWNVDGPATLINSTISGNTANGFGRGGGIYGAGPVTLVNSTVAFNQGVVGGGIYNEIATTLKNTIVASNISGGNCSGAITSLGHNLDSDNSCGLIGIGDKPGVNPYLGPLANNGGPTLTHNLAPASVAKDAGDNGACPAGDQRGVARPQGIFCDIGAYEAATGPYAQSPGSKYCVNGTSTGVGWSWSAFLPGKQFPFGGSTPSVNLSGTVASGSVPAGSNAQAIVARWVQSIGARAHQAGNCFTMTPSSGWIIRVNGCRIDTAGCSFNPTVVEEIASVGGIVEFLEGSPGRAGGDYERLALAAVVGVLALIPGAWYVRRCLHARR